MNPVPGHPTPRKGSRALPLGCCATLNTSQWLELLQWVSLPVKEAKRANSSRFSRGNGNLPPTSRTHVLSSVPAGPCPPVTTPSWTPSGLARKPLSFQLLDFWKQRWDAPGVMGRPRGLRQ